MYRTGQLARKAHVSLRTLRFYDETGLLSPSHYSEAGYRLYTNEDLTRLHHILALKFLGFTLEEIKAYLNANMLELEGMLTQQKTMMEEKRTQLDAIIAAIEQLQSLLQQGQCNWDAIIDVIRAMQMEKEQKQAWLDKYFTLEQLKTIEDLSKNAYTKEARQRLKEVHPGEWTAEDQKRVEEQYAFVKQELERLVASGADPNSPEAQKVARIKHELCVGFSKADPLLEESVKKWWEGFYALPVEQRPFDNSTYVYTPEEQTLLDQAIEIYHQRQ